MCIGVCVCEGDPAGCVYRCVKMRCVWVSGCMMEEGQSTVCISVCVCEKAGGSSGLCVYVCEDALCVGVWAYDGGGGAEHYVSNSEERKGTAVSNI